MQHTTKQFQCNQCKDTKCTKIRKICLNCLHYKEFPELETRCINCKWSMLKVRNFTFCVDQAKKLARTALFTMYNNNLKHSTINDHSYFINIVNKCMLYINHKERRSCLININSNVRYDIFNHIEYLMQCEVLINYKGINELIADMYYVFPKLLKIPTNVVR